MPSMSEWRQPYLLSNLVLVTESLTLIAGNSSVPFALHLVEPVDAGRGLLGDALDAVGDLRPALGVLGERPLERGEHDAPLLGVRRRWARGRRRRPRTRCPCGPASWRRRRRRGSCSGRCGRSRPPARRGSARCTTSTPPGSRPSRRRPGRPGGPPACRSGRRRRRRPPRPGWRRCCRSPAHLGAERDEGLDEDGGLHGHVQRAGDAGAGQRLGVAVLLAQRHEAGHLVLGQADLVAAGLGERQVGDLEVSRLCCSFRGRHFDLSKETPTAPWSAREERRRVDTGQRSTLTIMVDPDPARPLWAGGITCAGTSSTLAAGSALGEAGVAPFDAFVLMKPFGGNPDAPARAPPGGSARIESGRRR